MCCILSLILCISHFLYSGFSYEVGYANEVLIPVYSIGCPIFFLTGLVSIYPGYVSINSFIGFHSSLAFLYAIDSINSNENILPNVTIGYHIRDVMHDKSRTLSAGVDLLTNNSTIVIGIGYFNNYLTRSYDLKASKDSS